MPVVSDAQFMDSVGAVIGGTSMEEFVDATRPTSSSRCSEEPLYHYVA